MTYVQRATKKIFILENSLFLIRAVQVCDSADECKSTEEAKQSHTRVRDYCFSGCCFEFQERNGSLFLGGHAPACLIKFEVSS